MGAFITAAINLILNLVMSIFKMNAPRKTTVIHTDSEIELEGKDKNEILKDVGLD